MGLKMLIKALGLPEGSTVDDVIAALALAEGATVGDMLAAVLAALDSMPADDVPAKVPAPAPAPAPVPASTAPVAAAAINEEALAARIAASVISRIEIERADTLTPLEKRLLARATPVEAREYIATKVKASVLPGASKGSQSDNESDIAVAKATGLPLTFVKGGK